jgi:CcmD family protein
MTDISTATAQTQTGRDGQFRAVEGGTEFASGPTLLVEAYVVIWVLLLGFLLVGWRRQSRIEARMKDLEQVMVRSRTAEEEIK